MRSGDETSQLPEISYILATFPKKTGVYCLVPSGRKSIVSDLTGRKFVAYH